MKKRIIKLSTMTVTMQEMTIADISNLLENFPEFFTDSTLDLESYFLQKSDLVMEVARGFIHLPKGRQLSELNQQDAETLLTEYRALNNEFFTENKGKKSTTQTPEKLISDFNQSLAVLIQMGYNQVHQYTWPFYLDVVEHLKRQQK